jgi:hypothetical protein
MIISGIRFIKRPKLGKNSITGLAVRFHRCDLKPG